MNILLLVEIVKIDLQKLNHMDADEQYTVVL